MGEYVVYIEGQYDLDQINAQILSEEASFSGFVGSKIVHHQLNDVNMAEFRELPTGTIPEDITLMAVDEEQPAGTIHVWTGVMLVNNTTQAVSAYRAR